MEKLLLNFYLAPLKYFMEKINKLKSQYSKKTKSKE
jgi:hypothetical protein